MQKLQAAIFNNSRYSELIQRSMTCAFLYTQFFIFYFLFTIYCRFCCCCCYYYCCIVLIAVTYRVLCTTEFVLYREDRFNVYMYLHYVQLHQDGKITTSKISGA